MASSIYINSNSLYGRYVQFLCEQTAVNPVTNKSTVKWTLATKGANGSSVSVSAITCKVNGVTVVSYGRTPYTTHTFPAYGEQSVSGTTEIQHNSDGTKSVTVSLAANYNDTYSPIEQTSTWTLDPIPRTPYMTQVLNFSSSGDPTMRYQNPLGDAVTTLQACISLDGSTAFTSWIDIPKTGTQAGVTITTQERYDLITATSGTTRTVYYLLKSVINGTTNISSAEATFTVLENNLTRPTVSLAATPYNGSMPSAFNGKYIQGKSQLDVAITASGKFGATISSYSTVINGVTYTSASFRTDAALPAGTYTVTTTVTDSRGFTNSASASLTVYAYNKPELQPYGSNTEVKLYRSDNSGSATNTSTQLWLAVKAVYTDLDGTNTATLKVRSKQTGTSTWGSWSTLTMTSNAYNALITGTFAITNAYDLQVQLSDLVGEAAVINFSIPTEDVPLDLGEGGQAVGMGRYANTNIPYSVSIGWDAYFDGDIYVLDNNKYVPLPLLDMTTILNAVYPVGCLYWSSDNTNPATVLGIGTWTQITDTFVLAAGSTYTPASPAQYTAQAGEASHTLTVAELPSHDHAGKNSSYYYTSKGTDNGEINGMQSGSSFSGNGVEAKVKRTSATAPTGSDAAHNNMPPYLVRYCWERTA